MNPSFIQKAIEFAEQSESANYRHGAVIIGNHKYITGASNQISRSCVGGSVGDRPSFHAEDRVLYEARRWVWPISI